MRSASILAAALLLAGAAPWARRLERLAHPTPGDVIVIAHRACHASAPENSIAALKVCIAAGIDGVELDVRHTRDGVAVVMHDPTVDRTTDGHGAVAELTLAELQMLHLRAGSGGAGATLTGERIPTLAAYVDTARGALWTVMDVKDKSEGATFALLKAAHVEQQAIFFYECRNDDLLSRIRPFWDKVVVFPIAFDTDGPLTAAMARCPSTPANLIHVKWRTTGYLDQGTAVAKLRHERIWIATMFADDTAGKGDAVAVRDPQAVWGRRIDLGANMIMTNEPVALKSYLSSRYRPRN